MIAEQGVLTTMAAFAGGALIGGGVCWFSAYGRVLGTRDMLEVQRREIERVRAEAIQYASERSALQERILKLSSELAALHSSRLAERDGIEREQARLLELRRELSGSFAEVSAQALQRNTEAFLQLARESLGTANEAAKGELAQRHEAIRLVLEPVGEHIKRLEQHVGNLEQQRTLAYGELRAQVKGLVEAQSRLVDSSGALREETARLVSSLRSSTSGGRWGELQLRNVIELAGMLEYCDFIEQSSVGSGDSLQRPDVTVRLPGGSSIVVDAKAPLNSYLDAQQAANDDERRRLLLVHAKLIRSHCQGLSRKAYWQQFADAPDFVVLFLPGEAFYSAALQVDPELLSWSWEQNIILATPTMLIALLRTVAHGWRAASIERNAKKVSEIGRELYRGLRSMVGHVKGLGERLERSVEHYNSFIGSLEHNVLAKARRFTELEVVAEELPELAPVEKGARRFMKAELNGVLTDE